VQVATASRQAAQQQPLQQLPPLLPLPQRCKLSSSSSSRRCCRVLAHCCREQGPCCPVQDLYCLVQVLYCLVLDLYYPVQDLYCQAYKAVHVCHLSAQGCL
jgi:hypothetical protein